MEYSIAPMHNINGDVPIYPDRILFSEDLVNYIISGVCAIDIWLHGADCFRQNSYNAFSASVEAGVDNIIEKAEGGLCYNTDELNTWDKDTYLSIAAIMEKAYLYEGMDPLRFLTFCVHITLLARDFIVNGLSNAANLAAIVIYASLMNYDMFQGGWDALNVAAKDIINRDENPMTPDLSDSELQERSSPSSSSDDSGLANDDDVSSHESQEESILLEAVSEDTPISNDRYGENLQVPDIPTVNQNRELIHDFTSSEVREKDEAITQQEDVKDGLKINETFEDKNLWQFRVSANGRPLQQACECQKVVEGYESSTNGETHGSNTYETCNTIIDINLYFEYIEIRELAVVRSNDPEDDS